MNGPYRTADPPPPDDAVCCGMCHAAVGGCQYGVRWKVAGGWPWQTIPAGTSIDQPVGTPRLVWKDGAWRPCFSLPGDRE